MAKILFWWFFSFFVPWFCFFTKKEKRKETCVISQSCLDTSTCPLLLSSFVTRCCCWYEPEMRWAERPTRRQQARLRCAMNKSSKETASWYSYITTCIEWVAIREFPEAFYTPYSSNRELKFRGHFHEEVLVPATGFLHEANDPHFKLEMRPLRLCVNEVKARVKTSWLSIDILTLERGDKEDNTTQTSNVNVFSGSNMRTCTWRVTWNWFHGPNFVTFFE